MERKCPICNSVKSNKLFALKMIKEKGNPLPNVYDIVSCGECGFAYANVNATQTDYNEYYASFNVYGNSNDIKQIETAKRLMYQEFSDAIEKKLSKDSKILDVGCGGGGLLMYFQEVGYSNLYGLDPSDASVENIKNHGINGICKNIFDEIDEEYVGKFDCVISTAVIEHIYDINGYMEQLKKYIKSDGYLMISAPAVEGFSKYINPIPDYFNQEHINYFSMVSIRNVLAVHGLRVVDKGFNYANNNVSLWTLATGGDCLIQRDDVSQIEIEKYLKEMREKDKSKKEKIEEILSDNEFVIWGAGAYTMQLLAEFPDLQKHIKCFIDNNTAKQGGVLNERKICSPDYLVDNKITDSIVICSMHNAMDIEKQIREMGFDNKIYII